MPIEIRPSPAALARAHSHAARLCVACGHGDPPPAYAVAVVLYERPSAQSARAADVARWCAEDGLRTAARLSPA